MSAPGLPAGGAGARSALVALIDEAEPVLAGHRWRLDPRAAAGLSARVTVLAPFLPPPAIDGSVIARLGGRWVTPRPSTASSTRPGGSTSTPCGSHR